MKVFNTLTGKKEEFKPREEGHVRMYVCGVTVYDYCHVGHARSQVVFDTIYRYLRWKGYKVTYVRNFTDVDDKIINRAHQEGRSWKEVAEEFTEAFYEDMEPLGIEKPDHEPKATEHIPEMIELIKKLIDRGHAYVAKDGVYFDVKSFPGYGKLSKRTLDEMMAGARVEPGEGKRHPLDFALWKASKEGEPAWDSPWGPGRPGWHIEYSAMSIHYLGPSLDIHGGGLDLVFPHHENEIAQSEGATGVRPFVRYWVHNGFLQIRGEKMSKSLGNYFTIREILKEYNGETLRLFLLSRHYRSPVDFSPEALREHLASLERLYFTLFMLMNRLKVKSLSQLPAINSEEVPHNFPKIRLMLPKFQQAMDDDFNTPLAIAGVFEALGELSAKSLKRKPDEGWEKAFQGFVSSLKEIAGVLGVFGSDPLQFIETLRKKHCEKVGLRIEEVERLIEERSRARAEKDFERADSIRAQLGEKGIILEDYPEGTQWRVRV